MNTKKCAEFIVAWVKSNPGKFPLDEYAPKLLAAGENWIGDGTRIKDWKRTNKRTDGQIVYREFVHSMCIFDRDTSVVITETNGTITNMEIASSIQLANKYHFKGKAE